MSADAGLMLADPFSLAWEPELSESPANRYRLLDAPLSRLSFGAAISLEGCAASDIPVDWDWSASWEQNISSGAFPEDCALLAGRRVSTLYLLAAACFVFLAGKQISGERAGLAAALLFGLNSLVLLHGRRAMSEGVLLFGVAFAIWGLLQAARNPALGGVTMAVAVLAKFSPAPLLLAGIAAAVWPSLASKRSLKQASVHLFKYLLAFYITCFIFLPVLWLHPFDAAKRMLAARAEFTARQVELMEQVAPQRVLRTPMERGVAMLADLFLVPPAVSDVGNYDQELQPQADAYFMYSPLTSWSTTLWGGGLLLVFALTGAALTGLRWQYLSNENKRAIILLLLSTLIMLITLLAIIQIPIQRYYLPLVPFIVIWAGFAFMPVRIHRS